MRFGAKSTRYLRLVWPILLIASFAGCSAMEGVNVGANLPIGGIVSVGANKTIGRRDPPAQTPQAPETSKKPAGDDESDDSTTEAKQVQAPRPG